MVVVRSPVAHGLIANIDASGAEATDGVVAVWTAADVAADLGSVPRIPPRVSFDETALPYLQPIVAVDRVRYVGEPLAVVFATDRYVAEDAAERVMVDIEPLPAVIDPLEAAGAEQLFPEGNLNTTLHASFGEPATAFADAPVVVRTELSIGRHTGVPMETRGILVDYESDPDRCFVYGATKVPHWNRSTIAQLLWVDPARIVMRETAVGGGFGVRGELYPEDVLAVWAALRLKTPVKWIEDRREHLMAANHSREQHHLLELVGFDESDTGLGEGLEAHVAAGDGPFVVLFCEERTDESDDRGLGGEDADDVGAAGEEADQNRQGEQDRRLEKQPGQVGQYKSDAVCHDEEGYADLA